MKLVIFYGTDCNSNTAWIPWLCEQLKSKNIDYIVPELPTPQNQTYKNWSNITNKIDITSQDMVIGWSTGAIFAVRYLFENKIKVKKLILISGFNNYVGNVPEVDNVNKDFFIKDEKVASGVAQKIICIKSNNDPFITQEALNSFANNLQANIINIQDGGHFNANAGYTKFEELLKLI